MSAGATGAAAFVVQRGPLVLTALPEGSQLIITNPSALTTQLIVYRQVIALLAQADQKLNDLLALANFRHEYIWLQGHLILLSPTALLAFLSVTSNLLTLLEQLR